MSRRGRGGVRPAEMLAIRRRVLVLALTLAGAAVLTRAFQLQAVEQERWSDAALDQQRERIPLAARRGTIYDRDGVPLALSHETYRVSVAPREIRERKRLIQGLREVLELSEREARRVTDSRRRWIVLSGRVSAEQRKLLGDLRGLHFERRLERFYPQGAVGREVLGVVASDGRALGGVEQQMDSLLSGEPGYSVLRRDARGEARPALSLPVVPPRDGADVHLTIDLDLQEIATEALREAIATTGSAGGDLLILGSGSGEVLAAVSRRGSRAGTLAAITEPYEPGSTLKPFMVAALLAGGGARLTDEVDGEDGLWRDPTGRLIRDIHVMDRMTLREALVESSNVGMVKFSSRLAPAAQYEFLRDFGFGTPTGVEYPSEAAGRLRRPAQWSALSAASLAMGYELSVTPLQLALAYGALANEGVLMEPYLVREVRQSGGEVVHRRDPRPVRRVVPSGVARALTDVLVEVVEEGTATRASLANFAVAGKTGTARRTGANGRYEVGAYTSTFVSYFPAPDPQLVILVKLDRPTGAYYGGVTAAPVTRETLQGILAAHTSALDGRSLLKAWLAPPLAMAAPASDMPAVDGSASGAAGAVVLGLAGEPSSGQPADAPVAIPALEGLRFRDAARLAHALGLRVRLVGKGPVRGTDPAAGGSLPPGDTLLLIGEGGA